VLVVAGERLARYGFGDGHPFGPDRHAAFYAEFTARGLDKRARIVETRAASRAELESFHTREYLDLVAARSLTGEGYLDAGDTPAWRGVYEAAADVVGATLLASEEIMAGRARRAFIPIAGLHHAARGSAAGFCVFNDCGVAVEMLRRNHGLKRIAYVDIDAHHGDGVYYGFENDPVLIFADIHEDGRYLYPGTGREDETGRGAAVGTKLNIPVPPGADDAVFDAVWPRVLAHLRQHQPEFILLQAGADSIEGDPITHMRYTAAVHERAARDLAALAEELGHGRVLGTGGGGYNRINLAQAWTGVVQGLG
jgi:acetoin utilization protein AcuC